MKVIWSKYLCLKKSKVPFKTMNYSNRNHITGDKQKPQVLGLFWSTTIKATVVFSILPNVI